MMLSPLATVSGPALQPLLLPRPAAGSSTAPAHCCVAYSKSKVVQMRTMLHAAGAADVL